MMKKSYLVYPSYWALDRLFIAQMDEMEKINIAQSAIVTGMINLYN